MAGNFSGDIGGEGRCARLDIAHSRVNRNQFGSDIHYKNIHDVAVGISGAALRLANQLAPHSLTLVHGIHGKQSEVGAIATEFEINAPARLGGDFREQKCSSLKHGTDLIGVGPVAINEEAFDSESEIDQSDDLADLSSSSSADFHRRNSGPETWRSKRNVSCQCNREEFGFQTPKHQALAQQHHWLA